MKLALGAIVRFLLLVELFVRSTPLQKWKNRTKFFKDAFKPYFKNMAGNISFLVAPGC
jgi:hypothetical protein